ncbi:MAG: hypothetical protein ACOCXP_03805 [Candidatus Dojkabacteria bacterium]
MSKFRSISLKVVLAVFFVISLLIIFALVAFALRSDSSLKAENFLVTNVSSNSVTIIFTTPNLDNPKVLIKEEGENWIPLIDQLINTEPITEESEIDRYSHQITISSLEPETRYQLKLQGIVVGKDLPVVETSAISDQLTVPEPGYGQISGVDTLDSIIVFSDTSKSFSERIQANGTYSVDLSQFNLSEIDSLNANIYNQNNVLETFAISTRETKPFPNVSINPLDLTVSIEESISQEPTENDLLDEEEGAGRAETNAIAEVDTEQENNNQQENEIQQENNNQQEPLPEPDVDFPTTGGNALDPLLNPEKEIETLDVARTFTQPVEPETPTNPGNNNDPDPVEENPTQPTPSQPAQPQPAREIPICQTYEDYQVLAKEKEQLTGNALSSVSAQAGNSNNSNSGSNSALEVEEDGRIAFFEGGNRIAEQEVVLAEDQESVQIRIFFDENGDGKKNASERYMQDYQEVRLQNETEAVRFDLNAGWNLIHIPLIDDRIEDIRVDTLKKLINHWERQNDADIRHIVGYAGGNFQFVTKRESGVFFGNDRDLVPGLGLFVFSERPSTVVTYSGRRIEPEFRPEMSNGWNLIGLGSEELTAEKILNEYQNSTTFSQYENGIYQNFIKDDGIFFGNNYRLISKRGYFVRIEDETDEN